jgi:copper chaperone CopZ
LTTTTTYRIAGMSCEHCVHAVTSELRKVVGVSEVTVDLDAGTATVLSTDDLDRADVAAAVDEAGYELSP